MKTPDEIKRGLEECGKRQNDCVSCPYNERYNDIYVGCITDMCADALTYIRQLEGRQGRGDA